MTGSLVAALPSVDSFSDFSSRSFNRAMSSPISAASGSRSARAKEEDEELFRDLFGGEYDSELNGNPSKRNKPSWTFIPQKPATNRAVPTTRHSNPRHHLAPVKLAPSEPVGTIPFIPRLKLEELVNARPDHDSDDDNNVSRRSTRRTSDLEQVAEEDEFCWDDGPNEDNAAPRISQVLTHSRGLSRSLGFASNNQRTIDEEQLDLETRRFLEKLDLKSVLQTPRPDLHNFYPGIVTTPTTRSLASPYSTPPWNLTNHPDTNYEKNSPRNASERAGYLAVKELSRSSKIEVAASRLAYMESTYGTMPIFRKTRRETINRLANPISGHSSTLQALSPKQREKRESALTSQAPFSPLSAIVAVSCRRGTTLKKGMRPNLFRGLSGRVGGGKIQETTRVPQKFKAVKRHDPLVNKRRPNLPTTAPAKELSIRGQTKRKKTTTLEIRSLNARIEALKKKLQTQSSSTKRGGGRKVGGSTFMTQCDDEEGIEQIENFIAQHRGAAQASLTFRSSTSTPSHRTTPAVPARSRPRTPQSHTGAPFVRTSKNRGVASDTNQSTTERKSARQIPATYASNTLRSGRDPPKIYSQPRRPQAWQTSNFTQGARGLKRATAPDNTTNPVRKLKNHSSVVPKSMAATLLMGSGPLFFLSSAANESKSTRRNMKKNSTTGSANSSRATKTKFDAPTKQSEQRKRPSITSRLNGGDKKSSTRQTFTVKRTSRL